MLIRHLHWLGAGMVILVAGCSDSSTGAPSNTNDTMRNASSTDDSLLTQARREIEEGQALLLDVREQDEWDREHLTVAIWIPMSQLRDETQRAHALQDLPAGRRIYTHCAKGVRARMCAEMLQQLGYDAVPLTVAYDDLVAAGFRAIP